MFLCKCSYLYFLLPKYVDTLYNTYCGMMYDKNVYKTHMFQLRNRLARKFTTKVNFKRKANGYCSFLSKWGIPPTRGGKSIQIYELCMQKIFQKLWSYNKIFAKYHDYKSV